MAALTLGETVKQIAVAHGVGCRRCARRCAASSRRRVHRQTELVRLALSAAPWSKARPLTGARRSAAFNRFEML